MRIECRKYFWQSSGPVISQMLRYCLQTKALGLVRWALLISPTSFVTCRLKMNMAVTSAVIMTTCVSCRSSSTTIWAMTCCCSPLMGHMRCSCSVGHCRGSMPQWTSDQVSVCNHSETQLRPRSLGQCTPSVAQGSCVLSGYVE